MALLSNKVIDLLDRAYVGATNASVGAQFFQALRPLGAKAIFARAYGAPGDAPTTEHTLARVSPPGWEELYAERRFQDCNYLAREAPLRARPFRWSEIKLITEDERILARTLIDCGFPDGLATPCHGPRGYVGVVSLAFEEIDALDPRELESIEVASIVVHSRMRDLAFPVNSSTNILSPRERDCIGFVAAGKTDSEIADALGIAGTTVLTHIEKTKKKLGARTRAQAVAMCVARGIL